VAFEVQLFPALRVAAWALALAIGLWVVTKRLDAPGRAFGFWVLVWAGGIQMVLGLQALATDIATQQLLGRLAYYGILFSSSAFACLVICMVTKSSTARDLALAVILGIGTGLGAAFALNHRAFVFETAASGAYASLNVGVMPILYPAVIWSGFLAGMLWLGWNARRAPPSGTAWLMAGLALFAADRFARTAALWLRDPATLGPGLEGATYGWFMLAFGIAVAWMIVRAQGTPAWKPVAASSAAGAIVGATAFATFGTAGAAGASAVPVLLSALLGPAYVALAARGVLARDVVAVRARDAREAILADAAR
jgi:hypothetical protein